jgi:hypothetical protein
MPRHTDKTHRKQTSRTDKGGGWEGFSKYLKGKRGDTTHEMRQRTRD